MTESKHELSVNDFADLFGSKLSYFSKECSAFIDECNFSFTPLSLDETEATLEEISTIIESGRLTKAGKGGIDRWEKGWAENLNDFINSNYSPESLTPKYVRPDKIMRLKGKYIRSSNGYFELDFYSVLRYWLYQNFACDTDCIYEFACGPGYNLHFMSKLFPDKKLIGLDWAQPAVELVSLIGDKLKLNISGMKFDMFSPDNSMKFNDNSLFLTMGGLEQLGPNHKNFIDFLLSKQAKRIIHIEPIVEMYNTESALDRIAVNFHNHRNYLVGLLPYLNELENCNKIKFIHKQRLEYGSFFHDGWSILIYEPL